MRRLLAAIAVLGFLFLVPVASAHVTVTAAEPAAAIPWGAPTKVAVTVRASCATVLAEYQVEKQKTELELGLKEDSPTWVTAVGDKIPFKVEMCGTDGNVESTGNITITPGPLAPGLQPVNLTAIIKDEAGEDLFPITVAYRGDLTITGPNAPEVMLAEGHATVDLLLNASINADSMIMIEVLDGPDHGTLNIPSSLDAASALADGQPHRVLPLQFAYTVDPGANFSMDMVALRFAMHAASDPGSAAPPQEIMFHFMMGEHEGHGGEGEHDHDMHDHERGAVPALDVSFVVLACLAAGLIWRRRA